MHKNQSVLICYCRYRAKRCTHYLHLCVLQFSHLLHGKRWVLNGGNVLKNWKVLCLYETSVTFRWRNKSEPQGPAEVVKGEEKLGWLFLKPRNFCVTTWLLPTDWQGKMKGFFLELMIMRQTRSQSQERWVRNLGPKAKALQLWNKSCLYLTAILMWFLKFVSYFFITRVPWEGCGLSPWHCQKR
jgi:hypothetical protein